MITKISLKQKFSYKIVDDWKSYYIIGLVQKKGQVECEIYYFFFQNEDQFKFSEMYYRKYYNILIFHHYKIEKFLALNIYLKITMINMI